MREGGRGGSEGGREEGRGEEKEEKRRSRVNTLSKTTPTIQYVPNILLKCWILMCCQSQFGGQ